MHYYFFQIHLKCSSTAICNICVVLCSTLVSRFSSLISYILFIDVLILFEYLFLLLLPFFSICQVNALFHAVYDQLLYLSKNKQHTNSLFFLRVTERIAFYFHFNFFFIFYDFSFIFFLFVNFIWNFIYSLFINSSKKRILRYLKKKMSASFQFPSLSVHFPHRWICIVWINCRIRFTDKLIAFFKYFVIFILFPNLNFNSVFHFPFPVWWLLSDNDSTIHNCYAHKGLAGNICIYLSPTLPFIDCFVRWCGKFSAHLQWIENNARNSIRLFEWCIGHIYILVNLIFYDSIVILQMEQWQQ